jgi:hypothetical protein
VVNAVCLHFVTFHPGRAASDRDGAAVLPSGGENITVRSRRLSAYRGRMTDLDARMHALDRMNALLDSNDTATVSTSMRLPVTVRNAAAIAVADLGVASSITALVAQALRLILGQTVSQAALDGHFEQYPHARPSLSGVALAYAEQTRSPLAERPELLSMAAEQILPSHPDADARDVLMWAQGWLSAHTQAAEPTQAPTAQQVRAHKLAELDRYLQWLEQEQGPPTPEQLAAADRWVDGLRAALNSADRAVVADIVEHKRRAQAIREAWEMYNDPADRAEVAATMRFLDGCDQ